MDYYNFHTHTSRCGHAFGEDEEYVIEAIKCGFSLLYFSDHIMFPFFSQPRIRGTYDPDFKNYLESINNLKEKYKDKLDINVGFECEYHVGFDLYYRDLLKSGDAKYLLLGQHYHVPNNNEMINYEKIENGKALYVEDIITAMKSGLFTYVCHPDQITYYADKRDEEYKELVRKLARASVKYHVPLELNVSKVENNRLKGIENYIEFVAFPDDTFWKVASEEGVEVVIGLDAHKPENVNRIGIEYGLSLVKKYGLKLLTKQQVLDRIKAIQNSVK